MRMYGLDLTGKDVESDSCLLFKDKITTFGEVEGSHKNGTVYVWPG
jgi:hypothetical protein